jgi:hypothetical protein
MAYVRVNGNAIPKSDIRKAPDTGVVKYSGNLADTTRWTDSSLRANTVDSSYYIKPGTGVAKALSAGTFVYMDATKFIIRRVSDTISGVSNTTLRSGASDFGHRHAIHKSERARTTFLSALSWSRSASELPTYTATLSNHDTVYSNDHAARPTLATPGELTYSMGDTGTPVSDDYEAKSVG